MSEQHYLSMSADKQPSRVVARAILVAFVMAACVLIALGNWNGEKSGTLTKLDRKMKFGFAKRNSRSQWQVRFIVSDFVQEHVLNEYRLTNVGVSKTFVSGGLEKKSKNGELIKYSFSSRRAGNSSGHIRFRVVAGTLPASKFDGFEIWSAPEMTKVVLDVKRGSKMSVRFAKGRRFTSHEEKLYEMFLKDGIVGSFIELDIKLGAAGFVADKSLPVAAITFFANTFAIQAKRNDGEAQWKLNQEEIEKANKIVKATQRLGRSPESMAEMNNKRQVSGIRVRMANACCILGPLCPICQIPGTAPAPAPTQAPRTCSGFIKACGNDCLGMCGNRCNCWSWVCGNCGCNCNCRDHDYYCSCYGKSNVNCMQMLKYSDCDRRCYVSESTIRNHEPAQEPQPAPAPAPVPPVLVWSNWLSAYEKAVVSPGRVVYSLNIYENIIAQRISGGGFVHLSMGSTHHPFADVGVSSDGATVVGVDKQGDIWFRKGVTQSSIGGTHWEKDTSMSGVKKAALGSSYQYVIKTADNSVWRRAYTAGAAWQVVSGIHLSKITVEGINVCGIDTSGWFVCWFAHTRWARYGQTSTWPGYSATYVSVTMEGEVWMVGAAGNDVYWMNLQTGEFMRMPFSFRQMCAATKDSIVGVNDQNELWVMTSRSG